MNKNTVVAGALLITFSYGCTAPHDSIVRQPKRTMTVSAGTKAAHVRFSTSARSAARYRVGIGGREWHFAESTALQRRGDNLIVKGRDENGTPFVSGFAASAIQELSHLNMSKHLWEKIEIASVPTPHYRFVGSGNSGVSRRISDLVNTTCDASSPSCDLCPDCGSSPGAPDPAMLPPTFDGNLLCWPELISGTCDDFGTGNPSSKGAGYYAFPGNISCVVTFYTNGLECDYNGNHTEGTSTNTNLVYSYYDRVTLSIQDFTARTPADTGWSPPFRAVVTYDPLIPRVSPTIFIDSGVDTEFVEYYGYPNSPNGPFNVIFSTSWGAPYFPKYAGYAFSNLPIAVL